MNGFEFPIEIILNISVVAVGVNQFRGKGKVEDLPRWLYAISSAGALRMAVGCFVGGYLPHFTLEKFVGCLCLVTAVASFYWLVTYKASTKCNLLKSKANGKKSKKKPENLWASDDGNPFEIVEEKRKR